MTNNVLFMSSELDADLSHLKFESQLKMDRFPPTQFSQTSTTEISSGHRARYCAHVHIDLFVGGVEDSLPESAPSKSLALQMGLSNADATTKIVGDKIGMSDIK